MLATNLNKEVFMLSIGVLRAKAPILRIAQGKIAKKRHNRPSGLSDEELETTKAIGGLVAKDYVALKGLKKHEVLLVIFAVRFFHDQDRLTNSHAGAVRRKLQRHLRTMIVTNGRRDNCHRHVAKSVLRRMIFDDGLLCEQFV